MDFRAYVRWLFIRPRHVWQFVLVLGAVLWFAFGCRWFAAEPRIRWAGTALQVAGAVTVILGMRSTRIAFNAPSLGQRIRAWFRDRPRTRRARAMEVGATALSMTTGHVYAQVRAGENASIEDRLRVLEQNVNQLQTGHQELQRQIVAETQARQAAITAAANEGNQALSGLRQSVYAMALGGLDLAQVGILWLIAGILLCGCSVEIAAWLEPPLGGGPWPVFALA
jgi:hypothetical protein